MANEMHLVIATFDTATRAEEVRKTLQQLDSQPDAVNVGNIGVVEKDAQGRIELSETEDHKDLLGEIAGTLAGAVTWVLYTISGAGNAPTAGSMAYEDAEHAIDSRSGDSGFSDTELYSLGERLDAGHSAVVMLLEPGDVPIVTQELEELGGTVISGAIPASMLPDLTEGC